MTRRKNYEKRRLLDLILEACNVGVNMVIGIVGNGVVGNAIGKSFESHCKVLSYDIIKDRSPNTLAEVLNAEIIFICLPTPQKEGSLECNTWYVDNFLMDIPASKQNVNLVIKSTVRIGYTRKAREKYSLSNLVHSPEFLTARTAVEDAANPTRNIIGYEAVEYVGLPQCADTLYALYTRRWPKVRTYCMTSDESEAVKLMQNSYSAVVIALLNEFRCLADKTGMDWGRVMNALLASGWLAPRHTQVPGPDDKRGFGGSCLPKDLSNLIQCMNDADIVNEVCRSADHRNKWVDRYEG